MEQAENMRTFVVLGHKAVTDDGFTLDDLCGSSGRMDVLLRSINSALLLSHGIRRDSEIHLILLGSPEPPRRIRISGSMVRYLNPDERSTGALIKQALSKAHLVPDNGMELESTPGVFISDMGFRDTLLSISPRPMFCLDASGEDVRKTTLPDNPVFILSDHMDFSEEDKLVIDEMVPKRLSLGPVVVHTHHAITLAHNEMDRT